MLVNQLELLNKDGCQSDHDMYQANSNGIQCGIVQQSHSKVNDAIQSTYMYEQQPTYIYHLNTQNTPSSPFTTPTKPFTQNNKNQRTREEGPADLVQNTPRRTCQPGPKFNYEPLQTSTASIYLR